MQAGAQTPAEQTGSGETDGYVLVWQDLFDGESLNPLRWDMEVNGDGGGNHELQYYTDRNENVRLGGDGRGNNCLILTARREQYKGRNFTSGRVNSKNRIAFTHGKLEASIMLPSTANGLWPAFWMMGNDYDEVGWPRCGETDILEMGNSEGIKNGTQDRFFNGARPWGQGWPAPSYAKSTTKAYSLQDGEYHLFTVIWDENSIAMYVDLDKMPRQNPYYKIDCPCDESDNEWSAGNYFHKDNFILFNLAVGGDFTGIHDASAITALNEENGQEASMYVNYVKIYQKGVASENLDAAEPGDMSGVADVLLADEAAIRYDGRSIVSDTLDMKLYSISGACVAATHCGNICTDGLSAGIYLATNHLTTKKIVVE